MAKTTAQTNNNNRQRGKNFERRMAKLFGMFRVPYSGSSVVFGEGDIRDHKDPTKAFYMGECKSMTPKSKTEVNFIIKAKWLDDLKGRAKKAGGLLRFLVFTKVRSPEAYVIISAEDFKFMRQCVDLMRLSAHNYDKALSMMRDNINEEWVRIYGAEGAFDANEPDDDESSGSDAGTP